jgi:hypothetical protein
MASFRKESALDMALRFTTEQTPAKTVRTVRFATGFVPQNAGFSTGGQMYPIAA